MAGALVAQIRKSGLKKRDQWIVTVGSSALMLLVLYAFLRWASGIAPATPWVGDLALTIHLVTVIPAVPLGAYLLLFPKGTPTHRSLGKVWIALMFITATSTLWLRNINDGDFSWIHLFVPFTFYSGTRAVLYARRGEIQQHRSEIIGMFVGALIIAGFATFVPGRTMWVWAFG